jgi:hypothetical protein
LARFNQAVETKEVHSCKLVAYLLTKSLVLASIVAHHLSKKDISAKMNFISFEAVNFFTISFRMFFT